VPILFDNYAYLLIDHSTKCAAVVDPAVPEVVIEFAEKLGVRRIVAVLTTHGHHDHAGGNLALTKMLPGTEVKLQRQNSTHPCLLSRFIFSGHRTSGEPSNSRAYMPSEGG
jgi:glyoxylase-like metal-dependent hydrolase (beta-lactamase superfamily II)